jgi:hypothetical protein
MQKLGVHSEALQERYLGMPTEVGRSPTRTFNFLHGCMWKHLNELSDRLASRAGKETLLKSVIQDIPTFVMSCFEIPVANCDSMRKTIANHWWGMENGKRKLHWRSWEWLSTPKALGGMGFRDLPLFNQAMLGRQCWRLLTNQTSLCARVLKARYYPDCDFWDAPKPRSSSYTWRNIQFGMKLLKKGIRWGIDDGKKTRILSDNWIPGSPSQTVRTLVPLDDDLTVDFLFQEGSRSWDADQIRSLFPDNICSNILQVPISRHGNDDFASWPFYTVRSAYHLAREERFGADRSRAGRVHHLLWGITQSYGRNYGKVKLLGR